MSETATCNFIGCEKAAEFEIWHKDEDSPGPYSINSHACSEHLELFKNDGDVVHKFRIPGDDTTISETPL